MLAVAGVLCLAFGSRGYTEPAAHRAVGLSNAPLATPLWSPRRVPALFGHAVAAANLQRRLAAITAPYPGCVSVDTEAGPVARVGAGRAFAGASTQKLLTAAAALAVLGAHHRFETRAVSDATVAGGVLAGDLTIVGGGDPVLTSASAPSRPGAPSTSLADLADAIVRAGVHRIDGALVADDSRYGRERSVPDWSASEVAQGDAVAIGALIVDGARGDDGRADPDPALTTVQKLATLLEARGVDIANGVSDPARAASDRSHEIAKVQSPPLAAILEQMLTVSNNETAELLAREVGLVRGGAGTTAAGAREIPAVLARVGVPVAGVTLHDGSGLAPDDRVTCEALSAVVALGTQARFATIGSGLAIAGRSGTLAGRFVGTSLAGRLRAKTGHIDGAVGLAGIVAARPSGGVRAGSVDIRFAFLANGNFSTATGENLQDQIAEAIGEYVDAPVTPNAVPAPL